MVYVYAITSVIILIFSSVMTSEHAFSEPKSGNQAVLDASKTKQTEAKVIEDNTQPTQSDSSPDQNKDYQECC